MGVSCLLEEIRVGRMLFDKPVDETVAVLSRRPLGLVRESRVAVRVVHASHALQVMRADFRVQLFTQELQQLGLSMWIELVGLNSAEDGSVGIGAQSYWRSIG
jgi:hypothetical protein